MNIPNGSNLSQKQVFALTKFYDQMNPDESSLEFDILNKAKAFKDADQLFHLIVDDENSILRWKGALRIQRYFKDTEYWTPDMKDELYNVIKQFSVNPLDNKGVVTQLTKFKGISFPIASTVAFFFSQQNCPIIDFRAVETLQKHGRDVRDRYDWDAYFDICYELKHELGISFRELDKALWVYPDVEDYIAKYEKLQELGLAPHKE